MAAQIGLDRGGCSDPNSLSLLCSLFEEIIQKKERGGKESTIYTSTLFSKTISLLIDRYQKF
jgi:hypothetical protein